MYQYHSKIDSEDRFSLEYSLLKIQLQNYSMQFWNLNVQSSFEF